MYVSCPCCAGHVPRLFHLWYGNEAEIKITVWFSVAHSQDKHLSPSSPVYGACVHPTLLCSVKDCSSYCNRERRHLTSLKMNHFSYHTRNLRCTQKQLAYSVSSGRSHPDKLKFDGRRSADKPSFVDLSHEGLSCFILGETRNGGSLVNHTLLIGRWWL